ncbi:MAG TPA: hypothetical protein DIU35_07025 [Candidatus Latescibacteria bacterium]|nr:hypothetical protein [Gemmatimonadota bacterium]HCR17220.1 hypothetical protein [Candidatus Latescibacterota bacterium]|tara:strand:- start:6471 stop:6806 length:336 start_codon:yes stop_codon:yes gene_type:complete
MRGQSQFEALDARKQEILTLTKRITILHEERSHILRQLSKSRIYSPSEGTVLTNEIEKREGDLIRGGETLLEIAPLGSWCAKVLIREFDIPKVRKGQSAKLYVEASPHMEY